MDQRLTNLYAAVVRQAFHDVAHDYHGKGMDAREWLLLAGLIADDGSLPYGSPSRRRDITTTTEDYNARRRVARTAERRRDLQEV